MSSRFVVSLFVALAVLGFTATATLGHAELESTDPADGASITTPYTITGTFTEPLVGNSGVVIRNSAGEEVARSSVSASDDATVLEVALPELPAGDYVARWTATTEDGHTERFTTEFTVVAAAPSPTPTEAPSTVAPQTAEPLEPTEAPATTQPTAAASVAPTATPEPAEPTTPSSSNDLLIALLIAGIAVAGVLGYLFMRNRR
jgi:methionine-rich copper-binding protein CopC